MSYIKLEPSDFVVSADSIVMPTWTNNAPTLTAFYTSSTWSPNPEFYLNVYQTESLNSSAEIQFNIAYGHVSGSGSTNYNDLVPGYSPSRTIYGQYRTLVFGDENTGFTFGQNIESPDILAIGVERLRYKEHLLPGSLNLHLSGSAGNVLKLTDNSLSVVVDSYLDCGRVYDIVSGSSGAVTAATVGASAGYTISGSYGYFLPDIGTIILNPRALALPAISGGIDLSINTSSDTAAYNYQTLYNAMSGSGARLFQLNSEETISSNYVFVRVKNQECNYTTNPSMISGSGEFVYSSFINSPQTFITTIGLYNDNNELLAVAKTSTPLPKDFTKEALFRVKLDW